MSDTDIDATAKNCHVKSPSEQEGVLHDLTLIHNLAQSTRFTLSVF